MISTRNCHGLLVALFEATSCRHWCALPMSACALVPSLVVVVFRSLQSGWCAHYIINSTPHASVQGKGASRGPCGVQLADTCVDMCFGAAGGAPLYGLGGPLQPAVQHASLSLAGFDVCCSVPSQHCITRLLSQGRRRCLASMAASCT